MPRGGGDTRAEIMAVAMRLFVEQGYDKTSLREIADELGVTKAALYYHFRTKDEIVRAAMAAHAARVDEVIGWLETARDVPDRDEQLIDRLLAMFTKDSRTAMQFGQANPTAMAREEFGSEHAVQLKRLMTAVVGGRATAESAMRATLAFGAVVMGSFGSKAPEFSFPGSDEERRAAAKKIALEILVPAGKASP